MTLNEIANELVEGCRSNTAVANLDRLYAPDCRSVEAQDFGGGREVQGLQAIKGKHDYWESTFEFLGGSISDPFPNGDNQFAVIFEVQTKHRETGEIADMKEVALYTVDGGKIVKEEFLYPPE